jgi:electron transport complex protein RnfC
MMMFRSGRHLPEEKRTADSPIVAAPLPQKAILPLNQHVGIPAKPVVQIHSRVKTGQIVAAAEGFISANIHASISGKIASIGPHQHPDGSLSESIVIESDGMDEKIGFDSRRPDTLSSEDILFRVRAAGIVGLGGAAFPTHVKLEPPKDRKIDSLILNGCECEPYLTADHRVMLEETDKVLGGLVLAMRALGVQTGIVAIENNKPDALAGFTEAIRRFPRVRVVSVKAAYPQGSEKQLIKTVLRREVPSGKLPMDVGCVVQNVQTAKAIHDAVCDGTPLFERVLTVTGSVKRPANIRVRIGTPLSDLIDFCGGLTGDVRKLIFGGPMMGLSQTALDVPVIKGTSGVVALSAKEARRIPPSRCIRCGRCVEACEMGLVPMMMGRLMERGRTDALDEWSYSDCMECGRCSYECPAKIPLLHYIRMAKVLRLKKQTVKGTDSTP